tara:strand:- start:730 stop:1203 length:474 start_codon:yes stop_codon:yes gene_type:complete
MRRAGLASPRKHRFLRAGTHAKVRKEDPSREWGQNVGSRSNDIGGWLTKEEGEKFQALAFAVGLDESALATILVVRELAIGALASDPSMPVARKVRKEKRITARPTRDELKVQFREYSSSLGSSMDATAAALFRKEIAENWLGKTMGLLGNQIDSHR